MPSEPTPLVRVSVPAKINLWLGVGDLRPDGFHELQTVFYAVDLVDEVTASAADRLSLRITGITEGVPTDERNLAWRAAALIAAEAGRDPAVRLRVHKRIPVAGGLAGGSADAAGALLACNALWGNPVPARRLAELAAQLGSDVAFALVGGAAVGTGRGEVLAAVACPPLHWVLVPAPFGIPAADAYRRLDELRAADPSRRPAGPPVALLAALAAGDVPAVAGALTNDLQTAAVDLQPALTATLAQSGPTAIVSGSGPTIAVLCHTHDAARTLAATLGATHPGTVVASGPVEPWICLPNGCAA